MTNDQSFRIVVVDILYLSVCEMSPQIVYHLWRILCLSFERSVTLMLLTFALLLCKRFCQIELYQLSLLWRIFCRNILILTSDLSQN